jgi:hypothetical protein
MSSILIDFLILNFDDRVARSQAEMPRQPCRLEGPLTGTAVRLPPQQIADLIGTRVLRIFPQKGVEFFESFVPAAQAEQDIPAN